MFAEGLTLFWRHHKGLWKRWYQNCSDVRWGMLFSCFNLRSPSTDLAHAACASLLSQQITTSHSPPFLSLDSVLKKNYTARFLITKLANQEGVDSNARAAMSLSSARPKAPRKLCNDVYTEL